MCLLTGRFVVVDFGLVVGISGFSATALACLGSGGSVSAGTEGCFKSGEATDERLIWFGEQGWRG